MAIGAPAGRFLGTPVSRLVQLVLLGLLAGYQRVVSPVIAAIAGPRCRFAPSCSEYAVRAVRIHGPWRGSWLAVRRLLRCQPFHPGGFDPVPPAREAGATRC